MERRRELSSGRVLFHLILFGCTAISTTITGGAFYIQAADESLNGPLDALFAFFRETATGNIDPLSNGLLFTFTLLIILAAHEFGHYFACRHYGIRATLPFFLPAPPLLTLLGTFGAVIKIKEPIRSRKALFDIGIAGPLAGFVFALPASLVGLMFASPAPPATGRGLINDPPLFVLINILFGVPKFIQWNPIYWAAWGTVLITSLNLFPVGQLDGGHVMYAVLGPRWHKRITIAVCVAVASLATYTLVAHQPPVYLLWTVVLLFLARVGHPPVEDQQPLGKTRLALAAVALIVFLLCFMPFPISDS
ncbi:MAG TPA: site-2 protease family protein [Blastocatellia bacterium]|nr:site-2 protease family protein [Blastocatellia bacterium]